MAVKLRLRRMGKKRQPVYKVVAADERSPRDGKFIESIGLYNPKTDPAIMDIDETRALYWLGVGAIPTDTVKNILSKKGILLKRELLKGGLPENEVQAKMDDWNKIAEARAAAAASKKSKKQVKTEVKTESKENKAEKVDSIEEVKGTASEEQEPVKE